MPLTFRTSGAWGAGKGSNLTPAEADSNIYQLLQRIRAIGKPIPVMIESIEVTNDTITVTMEDESTYEFDAPYTAMNHRGAFSESEYYEEWDTFTYDGSTYLCISEASPGAFATVSGATTVFVVLAAAGPEKSAGEIEDILYYPVIGDEYKHFDFDFASGTSTFSLPADDTTDFAIGTEFYLYQWGTIATIVSGPSGVTINAKTGSNFGTGGAGRRITVKKIAADTWDIFGEQGTA